ncbi:MAG: aroK aroB [Actinomycetia bacterium]|nr:aroK aroB [Actinomycetes bacterium]
MLAGFMGAGKTTVGRLLAGSLRVPFLDSDHVIEARAGRSIPEIFAADGEPAFRALEHEVIADLLGGPDVVLALGGGAAEHEETRKLLAFVPVVFLRVSYAEAMARVAGDGSRPMLARPDITEVFQRRQAVYAGAATVTVDVDGRDPADVAQKILAVLP